MWQQLVSRHCDTPEQEEAVLATWAKENVKATRGGWGFVPGERRLPKLDAVGKALAVIVEELRETMGIATNGRQRTSPPCIIWNGVDRNDRRYSIGAYESITLTETEHLTLLAFLGDPPKTPPLETMDKPTLCNRSVTHAPTVLTALRTKYDGRFAPAIRTPQGKKSAGGYFVRIRRAVT
jgi:hypothetical protein